MRRQKTTPVGGLGRSFCAAISNFHKYSLSFEIWIWPETLLKNFAGFVGGLRKNTKCIVFKTSALKRSIIYITWPLLYPRFRLWLSRLRKKLLYCNVFSMSCIIKLFFSQNFYLHVIICSVWTKNRLKIKFIWPKKFTVAVATWKSKLALFLTHKFFTFPY